MLTTASLEKRLRFLLSTTRVHFRKLKASDALLTTATNQPPTISIPPGYDDDYTLRYLFHELCHYALPGELAAFGTFEEDILMRVLEPALIDHLVRSPRKHAWWLRQLAALRENSPNAS